MSSFKALGLADDATEDAVKAAWRELRTQHHPDHGGDADEFHRLRLAYEDALRQAQAPIMCPKCFGQCYTSITRGINTIKMPCKTCGGQGSVERGTTI